jgi:hypothetical protein
MITDLLLALIPTLTGLDRPPPSTYMNVMAHPL